MQLIQNLYVPVTEVQVRRKIKHGGSTPLSTQNFSRLPIQVTLVLV